MKITLTNDAYQTMLTHAQNQFPLEACGLIAGRVNPENPDLIEISQAYPVKNIFQSRERFGIDPKDQLAAIKAFRDLGLTPLGNFHSHPETPARPSQEDLKLYLDDQAIYLIISLADRRPVLKAFGLKFESGQTTSLERDLELLKPQKNRKLN
jgi:proteasome lid subunit RPN8/RPN11